MRNKNFAVFILTHGRAGNVVTVKTLRDAGYTGAIFLIVDDQDAMLDEYKSEWKHQVLVFSKPDVAKLFDRGDNSATFNTACYARNVCHKFALQLGLDHFLVLDDDYTSFMYRNDHNGQYTNHTPKVRKTLDKMFDSLLEFYKRTNALTLCIAQGGDFIGGKNSPYAAKPTLTRKAMNSFFCATDRPFYFVGNMNEDVNTYVSMGATGKLFFTVPLISLAQIATQANAGGVTDAYLERGTFQKSFFSVMYQPSAVKIGIMYSGHNRIHHVINWKHAVPLILNEKHRKSNGCQV
jgi:hypothetical protein